MKTEFKVGNIEIGKVNILKGKEQFTVSDLIKILNKLNQDAPVVFGVAKKSSTCFSQNENFMFRLRYQDREAEWDENYTVDIITDGNF